MPPWYSEGKDGPLDAYLESRPDQNPPPVFFGSAHYRKLKELDLLETGMRIRVVHGFGADEMYAVTEDKRLEGLLGVFPGKAGIHEATILDDVDVPWELHQW